MPLPAMLLIAATLLPLAEWLVLLAMGRRLGTPLAGYAAAFFASAAFLSCGWALLVWINSSGGAFHAARWGKNVAPIHLAANWIPAGRSGMEVGLYLDSLSVAMCVSIAFVAMLAHFFALGSRRRNGRRPRVFESLALLTFAAMGLAVSPSLLQLLAFWIILTFASSVAVMCSRDDGGAEPNAQKAMIVQRIGTVAFLAGFAMIFARSPDMSLPRLWSALNPATGGGWLTAAGIALFVAAMTKAAQFPVQGWLMSAAEAPAPASGLFHTVATAAAGVFLLARLFPILTPSARLFIGIVGAVTVAATSLIALAQTDIRRALAANTSANLGLMMLAIGIGSWIGALFHLIAHAFCKAVLTLGSGAVVDATGGAADMAGYGGLWRKMPVTATTFAVAILGISGAGALGVGLSGYYSQGIILSRAADVAMLAARTGREGYWVLFGIAAGGIFLGAVALTRCWMLTFWGRPRDEAMHDRAREEPVMYWPLIVLVVMTALAGKWIGVRDLLDGSIRESQELIPAMGPTTDARGARRLGWPTDEPAESALAEHCLWGGCGLGILWGVLLYCRGPGLMNRFARVPPGSWLYAWLHNGMYFDDLYESVLVVPTLTAARAAAWVEEHLLVRPVDRALRVAARLRRRETRHRAEPLEHVNPDQPRPGHFQRF